MFSRLAKRLGQQFRWPGRRFFYGYCAVIAMLALAQLVDTLMVHPPVEPHLAADPGSAVLHNLALAGVLSGAILVLGAVFYVVMALYYRIVTEIYLGWLKFKSALPGFVAGLKRFAIGCREAFSALVTFVFGVPMRIASGYARLVAMTALERYMLVVMLSVLLLMGCTFWQMWPVSTNLAAKLPDWMDRSDSLGNLRNVLFIDCMLSMLLICVVMPIYVGVARVVGKALFKKG